MIRQQVGNPTRYNFSFYFIILKTKAKLQVRIICSKLIIQHLIRNEIAKMHPKKFIEIRRTYVSAKKKKKYLQATEIYLHIYFSLIKNLKSIKDLQNIISVFF